MATKIINLNWFFTINRTIYMPHNLPILVFISPERSRGLPWFLATQMMKTTASKLFARCGAGWPKPGSFPQGPQQSANSCWVQKIDVFFCWPPNKNPQKSRPIFFKIISKFFGVSEDLWEMGIYFETPFMAAAGIFSVHPRLFLGRLHSSRLFWGLYQSKFLSIW